MSFGALISQPFATRSIGGSEGDYRDDRCHHTDGRVGSHVVRMLCHDAPVVSSAGLVGKDGAMSVIEVTGLRKVYGERAVVDGVSFSVEPGEIFGILGPNGAGKTTTVECIGGLRHRDGGSVTVAGMDPANEGVAFREVLGIQLQESRLPEKMTVIEALDLYASFYPEPANPAELLERLGMVEQRKTYFGKLSGGQKQRLSVALALVGSPRVAILDELTTGLDPAARRDVWDLLEDLRDAGVTLLLVSHFMEEAERLCDRVIVINHGQIIAADTPEGLAASVQADQRMSFLPSTPVDLTVLRALPDVHSVNTVGERVVVTGSDNVPSAVIIALEGRSEERRVGKECRSRWSPYH